MTAQPGERTVSWLDEDDPNRGAKTFVPVEAVIDLTPTAEEAQPGKKSRREKPPKPPKPPRGKLWRRDKATQEKPPRENPPRDVTPRAEDWPAPAGEEWLTTIRDQEPRQDWAASRQEGMAAHQDWVDSGDTKTRDGGPAPEWTEAPDEAPLETGPHATWAAAPEDALDDGWTTSPPPQPPASEASVLAPRESWFTAREEPSRDDTLRDDDAGRLLRDDAYRPAGSDSARREEWGPDRDDRTGWDSEPRADDHHDGWNTGPELDDRRDGWDSQPRPDDRHNGWNTEPDRDDRRVGWGGGGGTEQKARPDWLTSLAPPAPDGGGWSEATPDDAAIPEAFPAPLDITPDDDLVEPPAKRRRGSSRPSAPPVDVRSGGRTDGRRPRRRRKPLLVLAIGLTAVVAAAAVVAAGTIYRLVFDLGTPGSHTIAAPVGGRATGELELATGAEIVTVVGADLGDDLFQVSTPESGDPIPLATIRGERTTVTLASNRGETASAIEIRLNSRVTWRLLFTAGAKTQTVDLSAGKLAGLEVTGGATRLELILPKPAGTVPIRLRGGLDELVMHAPRGVPTRVKLTKGATTVKLDRLSRSKVAADTTFTPDGWARAKARYDVDAAEGIGTVQLDRR